MSKQVTFPLNELVELFLHGRQYGIISSKDTLYRVINELPEEDKASYVIENEQWTIGYDTSELPALHNGLYRLWNKQDWINTDNRRKSIIIKMEEKQANYRAKMNTMKSAIKEKMVSSGVQAMVVDMLLNGQSDSQLESLYNTYFPASSTKCEGVLKDLKQ